MASFGRDHMSEIRELRRQIGLSQPECAALLSVPLETFRVWDSGRRMVPTGVLRRARTAVVEHAHRTKLLLSRLAVGPCDWRCERLARSSWRPTIGDSAGSRRLRPRSWRCQTTTISS